MSALRGKVLAYAELPELGTILGPDALGSLRVVLGDVDGRAIIGFADGADLNRARKRMDKGEAARSVTEAIYYRRGI